MNQEKSKIFAKNSLLAGILWGILLPAFVLTLLHLIVVPAFPNAYWLQKEKVPFLLALIPNLFLIRLYFINWKLDKAGRGVLLVTFIAMVLVFILVNH
jgi:hypothetical protein